MATPASFMQIGFCETCGTSKNAGVVTGIAAGLGVGLISLYVWMTTPKRPLSTLLLGALVTSGAVVAGYAVGYISCRGVKAGLPYRERY